MDTTLTLMDWYSKKNAVPVLGWFGGNVFRDFQITVDYQRRTMYWLRQAAAETSDIHQIGLTLRTAPGAVYVAGVARKNGKPTVEGVQPGDKLISVGGHVLTSGTIGEIFESMHGVPGDTRELVLERNGTRFTVSATITTF
jgi:C-terminal processing protease CtpA/Prc